MFLNVLIFERMLEAASSVGSLLSHTRFDPVLFLVKDTHVLNC